MTTLRPILVGFLLFGLFAIALVNFGLLLAINNNAEQSIGDEPAVRNYATSLNESLQDSVIDSQEAETAISDSPVTLTTGFPVFDAITGVWRTLKEVPVTIYNLTIGLLFATIFGSLAYSIIFGVIGAILTITIIIAVWRMVASGDGG